MALSGPEIQANLRAFASRWADFSGTEKGEAQSFLNELFACYGTDRREAGAQFEDFKSLVGFMDLHWPGICIFEMKRPGTDPTTARDQIQRYWVASADEEAGRRAARYVVICSFEQFEIWQPGEFPANPRASVSLADLPERHDVLNFLAGPNVEPSFIVHDRTMTKEAAGCLARMYESLVDRVAAPPQEIQRFVMQSVWCMFAEDLRMLHDWPFEKAVERLVHEAEPNSARELGWLFRVLGYKGSQHRTGDLAGTTYVNGDLFAEPAEVTLNRAELLLLREAVSFNWSQVDPTIFGSLMEGVLGDRRWELGAHYTHEVDIMKIVGPTIVRPWSERIDQTTTPQEARDLLDELCSFRVLDPACGCGNFLYVAYRELRALEALLKRRIRDLAKAKGLPEPAGPWPFVRLTNMQGIEIEPASALIARVTLWMGHRQMIDLYGEAEDPLPLVTLSTIQTGDALRVPWPETDCIVGNPPFMGDRLIRRALGDAYLQWLQAEFSTGVVDFSAYWFRRAVDHLRPGQRAGFVSTNTLRENKHRQASLRYVVDRGGVITDAVSSQKWPGEAAVHVSITNWVSQPAAAPPRAILDGTPVSGITARLTPGNAQVPDPRPLSQNKDRSFIGNQINGDGFLVSEEEASSLRMHTADREVVRRYLNGRDLAERTSMDPSRWVIDFGSRSLEDASAFEGPMKIVRERVKPAREGAARHFARLWWQFAWPRPEMRRAVAGRRRYVAAIAQGKRFVAAWADVDWCPSNLIVVLAFDDDFSMGVLQSRAHVAWAWHQSSTLETRLRYTPSSVFMTFPWPDRATDAQRERVADVCRRLLAHRSELCERNQVGLTKLYNAMDDGAYIELAALHRELDVAVADCYGWPAGTAQDDADLVARLSELNRQISEGERDYRPFA